MTRLPVPPGSPEVVGQLLTALAPASVVLDAQGRVVATSPAWEALAGALMGADVGVGVDYLAVCDRAADAGDPEAAQAAADLRRLLRGEAGLATVVYPCPMPDGLHWFRMIGLRLAVEPVEALVCHADLGHQPDGHVTSVTNTMMQMAVHELANPLTVVHGMLDRLAGDEHALSEEERAVLVGAARRQTHRMIDTLEELRDLMVEGHASPTPSRLRVGDAVAEARTALGDALDLRVTGDADAEVWADASHVVRVLANLFENARKYGQQPVTVEVVRLGGRLRLAVQDEGPGVHEDEAERLFLPHHRGAREAAMAPGAGLGLAMARDLLGRNGGTIRLDPGASGARFVLDLPAAGTEPPSGRT